ncbi:calcium-binding protein, partial [Lysobacter tyrosinilyticus]
NGNDTLTGNSGNDTLYGDAGNDTLNGGTGVNVLYGGAGDDTLTADYYGGVGNSFEGGTGNDTITGTYYADKYVFNLGDGQDLIIDNGYVNPSATYKDSLRFGAGIAAADVTASKVGNDLVLTLANGTDKVTVKNWFTGPESWLEEVVFADGTVWTGFDVTYNRALAGTNANDTLATVYGTDGVLHGGNGNDTLTGNNGNDTLYGDAGNDVLNGGTGVNVLYGGAGDDTLTADYYGGVGNSFEGGTGNDTITGTYYADKYVFNLGDGQDLIIDNGYVNPSATYKDSLRFGAGIAAADVTASKVGNDLVLTLANGTDKVTVKNWFTGPESWLEEVVFADGTVWTGDELTYRFAQAGTSGNDTINAVAGTNAIIHGLDGNDTLTGNNGNDLLYGDAGNDVLNGGTGINLLYGGAGDDTLTADYYGGVGNSFEGGTGNDTITGTYYADKYVFNLGDGQDLIIDNGYVNPSATYKDSLRFGAGIAAADVTAAKVGNDLVLTLANGTDKVTVKNWFTGPENWLEEVVFADGTVWTGFDVTYNRALAGTDANQT